MPDECVCEVLVDVVKLSFDKSVTCLYANNHNEMRKKVCKFQFPCSLSLRWIQPISQLQPSLTCRDGHCSAVVGL